MSTNTLDDVLAVLVANCRVPAAEWPSEGRVPLANGQILLAKAHQYCFHLQENGLAIFLDDIDAMELGFFVSLRLPAAFVPRATPPQSVPVHPRTGQLPSSAHFGLIINEAIARGMVREPITVKKCVNVLLATFEHMLQQQDQRTIPTYFFNMRCLEMYLEAPPPPAGLAAPSAEIFAKYVAVRFPHEGSSILMVTRGVALLGKRCEGVLEREVEGLWPQALVGFFWLHKCLEADFGARVKKSKEKGDGSVSTKRKATGVLEKTKQGTIREEDGTEE